jgi:hypothetical protein
MTQSLRIDRTDRFALLRRESIQFALLIAFALAIDLHGMGKRGSGDEGGQMTLCVRSPSEIMTEFATAQNHPFYGLLGHYAVTVLPLPPLLAMRVPAFLAGVLIPIVYYQTQRRWLGHAAAILSAFVLILVDPVRHYSSSGRGYSILCLGALVTGQWLLDFLETGRARYAIGYVAVAVASCYAHLWGFPIIAAHGAFVILEQFRQYGARVGLRRSAEALGAIVVSIVVGIALYWPMLPEILRAGRGRLPGPMIHGLVEALLQLIRFGSWTVAIHLVLVPIVLDGFARRGENPFRELAFRLHVTVIACVLAGAMVLHPINFGSRFLMGIEPSLFAVAAWGLSGYWRGRGRSRLGGPGVWLLGFALGVLVADARLSHEIPPGSFADPGDNAVVDLHRKLPRAIGNLGAVGLGLLGLVLIGYRAVRPSSLRLSRLASRGAIVVWTLVTIAAIVPLILGPAAFHPLWIFEVHMVAVGAIVLLAWEHRHDGPALNALRYGLLACAGIGVFWLAGVPEPSFDPWLIVKLAVAVLPMLVAVPLAGTTRTADPVPEP